MLKEISAEAKNFNNFHEDILIATIPDELKDHVKTCLFE